MMEIQNISKTYLNMFDGRRMELMVLCSLSAPCFRWWSRRGPLTTQWVATCAFVRQRSSKANAPTTSRSSLRRGILWSGAPRWSRERTWRVPTWRPTLCIQPWVHHPWFWPLRFKFGDWCLGASLFYVGFPRYIYIYYTEYVGISLFVMITIFQMNRIAEICLSQDLFILPKRNAHIIYIYIHIYIYTYR